MGELAPIGKPAGPCTRLVSLKPRKASQSPRSFWSWPGPIEPRLAGSFVAPSSVVLPLGEPERASAWTETIPGGWALLADGARCQQESLLGRFSGVAFDGVTPGPLRLAALEEIAPSTLRLGSVAELQAREGGSLWMGLLPGLGPAPASLRVEPEVVRPSSEEGPPLELVLHVPLRIVR